MAQLLTTEPTSLLRAARERQGAQRRTFHFQITAVGLGKLGADSEAELFKKLPTLEHFQDMLRADDNTVVIIIRGIGDMTPRNPSLNSPRPELVPGFVPTWGALQRMPAYQRVKVRRTATRDCRAVRAGSPKIGSPR